MHIPHPRKTVVLAMIAVGVALATPPAAGAATLTALDSRVAAAAAETGWLRLGHFSPDTVAVDVRVSALSGGTVLLELHNVGYGDISPYETLPAGTYAIGMIPTGSGDWTNLAVSDSVTVGAGNASTVAAYGPADDLQVQAFADDLTPPSTGNARVRVIQASTITPTVDVQTTTGLTIAADAEAGSATEYAEVPAGAWTLRLTAAGVSDEVTVDIAAGTVNSLFVLDNADAGLTIIPIVDSAGAALTPGGGVDTGGGWLAGVRGAGQPHATPRLWSLAV